MISEVRDQIYCFVGKDEFVDLLIMTFGNKLRYIEIRGCAMLRRLPWTYDIRQHSSGDHAIGIINRLHEYGYEAVLVGGCVRDVLLGRVIGDIDIATNAHPHQLAELFPSAIPVGQQFGVMILPHATGHIEVATFRRDGSYDGRRPDQVSFATEAEDVWRRDFTINGLVADIYQQEIRDRVGGIEDIRTQQLRCIGEAHQRFAEDQLRVLRGLRFCATYDFNIAESTHQALLQTPPIEVSRERMWQEWHKVFQPAYLGSPLVRWMELQQTYNQLTAFYPHGDNRTDHVASLPLVIPMPSRRCSVVSAVVCHDRSI